MTKATQITDIKTSAGDYLTEGMRVNVNITDSAQQLTTNAKNDPDPDPTHTIRVSTKSVTIINAVLAAIDANSAAFPST